MGARHPLPYAWAKTYSVLIEDDGRERVMHVSDGTSRTALAEVLRLHTVDRIERETPVALQTRIAQAYSGGQGSAASVVGEVESAVDLSRMMQELPAVEDLKFDQVQMNRVRIVGLVDELPDLGGVEHRLL